MFPAHRGMGAISPEGCMNDWPEGWYRKERLRPHGWGGAGNAPDDLTARYPGGRTRRYPPGSAGNWPEQPPLRSAPGRGAPGRGAPPRPPGDWGLQPRRRGLRPKRVAQGIAALIILIIVAGAGFYVYLNSKLTRISVLSGYPGRPAPGAGQNWLLTGSDSRQGLTGQQLNQLSLGHGIAGHRSDTIMVLHIPANGTRPVLVSIPRDSYVPIPGHGEDKINAAYDIGGPALLAQTVQDVTGLYISHYMGIGLGGLVGVVNDVGGVNMCIPAPLKDKASGLNLKAGCQTLNGDEALSFVRDRHSFATEDLQRIQDQRVMLKALLSKVTSPGTLINPFAIIPAAEGAASALQVDQGTQLYQLIKVAFALRNPETTTVPIAHANYPTAAGDAVLWDRGKALQLFHDLNSDTQPPADLVTGSKVG